MHWHPAPKFPGDSSRAHGCLTKESKLCLDKKRNCTGTRHPVSHTGALPGNPSFASNKKRNCTQHPVLQSQHFIPTNMFSNSKMSKIDLRGGVSIFSEGNLALGIGLYGS